MQKLITFDLDGTLIATSTWEAFNTLLGITADEDQRLFTLYKEGNLEYKDWIEQLMAFYKTKKSVTKNDIEILAAGIKLRLDAQEAIDDAKAKGYQVLLISGSVDTITSSFADRLGITEWFSPNKAVFNESGELISIEQMGHERDAKLTLLKKYCEMNNYEIEDVIAVGDGGNDKELFITSKGVLLGHNEELKLLAWQQIETLSELKEII
jgi:HAD superfamily phosphoserine phosphatase-like hydrolase